ncbi:MAG: hypothetical protein PHY02_08630 [Phycisphaerae bacterium]|nr:hypothetical protein [Phycisphaerae bacterium]
MARKKISPRIQQAAEKYLDSIGASKADLSDKQWEIVADYVKAQRMVVPLLLIIGIISIGVSIWSFRLGEKGMASIIPEKAHLIKFISKTGEESTPVNPDEIKNYTEVIMGLYWKCGSFFMLAGFCFMFAFVNVPLNRRRNKRVFEAFIPHRQEDKSPRT